MMVTNNPGLPPVVPPAQGAAGSKNNPGPQQVEGSYDRFQQTTSLTGQDRFRMELVSRITREVRTAVTTGDIQDLSRQVHNREYAPDPSAIAARILLRGENR